MIRLATIDDLDEIEEMERRLFPDDAWPREMLRDEIVNPHNVMIVDEGERGLNGYAAARCLVGNDSADIHNIAVAEAERGKGIGAALFDRLVAWCVERGASTILLEVRADNAVAQALYSSRGFEPIAIRPGYYQPASVDAVVMRREVTA